MNYPGAEHTGYQGFRPLCGRPAIRCWTPTRYDRVRNFKRPRGAGYYTPME